MYLTYFNHKDCRLPQIVKYIVMTSTTLTTITMNME